MASIAGTLSQSRSFRRPFRLNQRRVASLALMLAALLGGFAYVNGIGQQPTYAVLVATREVPRGAVLSAADLEPQRVALPDAMATASLSASELPQVVGQRLAEPLHVGVPVLRAQLAAVGTVVPGYQRIALAVGPEHAAGGRVEVGDSVRVYVSQNRGKPDARTSVVLERTTVSAVGYEQAPLGSGAGSDAATRPRGKLTWIELLVEDSRALGFLQAIASGAPDVAVLPEDGSSAAGLTR
jgi:Flp pilus assembly protein CpaB